MLFHSGQFDADLEEEMRLHLELREQQQLQAGMTQTNAHSAARRRFGNPTVLKEKSHNTWGWQWVEDLPTRRASLRASMLDPVVALRCE